MMSREVAERCVALMESSSSSTADSGCGDGSSSTSADTAACGRSVKVVDLTGGAPELTPQFRCGQAALLPCMTLAVQQLVRVSGHCLRTCPLCVTHCCLPAGTWCRRRGGWGWRSSTAVTSLVSALVVQLGGGTALCMWTALLVCCTRCTRCSLQGDARCLLVCCSCSFLPPSLFPPPLQCCWSLGRRTWSPSWQSTKSGWWRPCPATVQASSCRGVAQGQPCAALLWEEAEAGSLLVCPVVLG